MAKLTGQTIADSYDQLLIVDGASGITSSLQALESADTGGSVASLQISTVAAAIDNPTASSATQGGKLTLFSDDGAALGDTHRLGVIEFSAAEDTGSTITIGARIEAIANAAWSASENGADMVFYTTDGNASQGEVMRFNHGTYGRRVNINGGLGSNSGAYYSGDGAVLEVNSVAPGTGVYGGVSIHTWEAGGASTGPQLTLARSKSDTAGNYAVVADDDRLGQIFFKGADSNSFALGATIVAFVDGSPSDGDMPTRLVFATSAEASEAPADRMTISSAGNVGIGDTDPSEAKLSITGVASGDYALKIDQDQDKSSIYVDSEATSEHVIYVDTPTTTSGDILLINAANSLTTGGIANFNSASVDTGTRNLVSIVNDDYRATGATCLTLRQDSAGAAIKATSVLGYLNTGAGAGLVEITHTGNSSSNTNNLLFIKNDDASSSGTTCLFIDQDANYRGITIDSEATSVPNLFFLAPAMTTGQIIEVNDANSLTTGGCAYFFSNSPDNTSSRNLVTIVNENAAADKAVGLMIQQDGDDAHIEFTGAGQGGIKFTADISSSDAETLDDYEEGTWTGVIADAGSGGNAMTMNGSITTGSYTKVGSLVTVCGYFVTTSAGSASGSIYLRGLPFSTTNYYRSQAGATVGDAAGLDITATESLTGYMSANTTWISLRIWNVADGAAGMSAAEWSSNGGCTISCTYVTH